MALLTFLVPIPLNGQIHSTNCLNVFGHSVGLILKGVILMEVIKLINCYSP